MLALSMMKKVDLERSISEEGWEKLTLLFNEGEECEELVLDMFDQEAWLELKETHKELHDMLVDALPADQQFITLVAE